MKGFVNEEFQWIYMLSEHVLYYFKSIILRSVRLKELYLLDMYCYLKWEMNERLGLCKDN